MTITGTVGRLPQIPEQNLSRQTAFIGLKRRVAALRHCWSQLARFVSAVLLTALLSIPSSAFPFPDKILINAKIVTVDANFSIADAVAIGGGRITAVGSNTEIGKLAGPETEVLDLGGKTVVPGFIDAHAHMDREGLKLALPPLCQAR